jgi:hypothetical protein
MRSKRLTVPVSSLEGGLDGVLAVFASRLIYSEAEDRHCGAGAEANGALEREAGCVT